MAGWGCQSGACLVHCYSPCFRLHRPACLFFVRYLSVVTLSSGLLCAAIEWNWCPVKTQIHALRCSSLQQVHGTPRLGSSVGEPLTVIPVSVPVTLSSLSHLPSSSPSVRVPSCLLILDPVSSSVLSFHSIAFQSCCAPSDRASLRSLRPSPIFLVALDPFIQLARQRGHTPQTSERQHHLPPTRSSASTISLTSTCLIPQT